MGNEFPKQLPPAERNSVAGVGGMDRRSFHRVENLSTLDMTSLSMYHITEDAVKSVSCPDKKERPSMRGCGRDTDIRLYFAVF